MKGYFIWLENKADYSPLWNLVIHTHILAVVIAAIPITVVSVVYLYGIPLILAWVAAIVWPIYRYRKETKDD